MRLFTQQQQQNRGSRPHNVGAMMPASIDSFIANMGGPPPSGPAGGTGPDGSTCPQCPPGIDRTLWAAVWRRFGLAGCMKLCNLSGGTPGLGYGGMCAAPDPPALEYGADGCAKGWNQCKQPLAITALAVGAGLTQAITVTPRQRFRAYQLITHDATGVFLITGMNVNGVEYLGSNVGVSSAAWSVAVTDHSVDIGEFSSTTPLIFSVQNTSGLAADFRATLLGAASRS